MARFKKLPQVSREGKIVYGNGIVEGIVYFAVSELEFVELADLTNDEEFTEKTIRVSLSKNLVDVWVNVKIHFSQSVSETSFKIQEAVRHNIETMTEYRVNSVNVKVSGIVFSEPVKPEVKEENKEVETEKQNNQDIKSDK